MITAQAITILVDISAFLVILSGFLFGLKRGLKASVNRLLLVLITAVLAIILTKALSGTAMNIKIPFLKDSSGTSTSVSAYIDNLLKNYKLTDTISLGSFTLTIEALVTVIKLITNVFVFFIIFELFRFITWIVFMIFFRTKKSDIVASKEAGSPINLHRWWGSLVGAFQGLIVFVLLFLPISGLSSIGANINSSASAADEQNGAGIIETFVPEQYQSYLNVYENSIFNKAFGWTKLDEFVFDTLTTTKIDGVEIKLRNEVVNANDIVKELNKYEIIDAFKQNKLEEKLNNLTDEEINKIFTDVFNKTTNFSVLKFLLIDSSNILADSLSVNEKLNASSIDWANEGKLFGNGISDIICSTRPVLTKVIKDGTDSLTDEILASDDINYARFGKGFDTLAQMQLIKNSYKQAIKKVLELDKIKQFGEDYGIDFSTINLDNLNFEKAFDSIGKLLRFAVKLKNNINLDDLTKMDLKSLVDQIKELNPDLVSKLNEALIATLEDQFNVDIPDDVNLFEDDGLIDSAVDVVNTIKSIEAGETLTSEKAKEVLETFEAIADNSSSQALLNVVSKSTGVTDNFPTVTQVKNTTELLDDYISAADDAENLNDLASDLVTSLNAQMNLVKLLKFKNNKYEISLIKYNLLQTTAMAQNASTAAEIMSLFVIAE